MAKMHDPIEIRGMELPHRLVVAPNGKGYANLDGSVSERLIESYRQEAEGAFGGLVQVGVGAVRADGRAFVGLMSLSEDIFIPGQYQLANAIRLTGAKSSIQIFHAGAIAPSTVIGTEPVAPVPMDTYLRGGRTRALKDEEVEEIVEAYGRACERAKEAGYDSVNLHFTHGSLPMQFYSKYVNTRKDRWGEKRKEWGGHPLLFPLRVIERVRKGVGNNYPIIVRISGHEYTGNAGYGIEDASNYIAPAFVEAGADCIDVSAGRIGLASGAWTIQPVYFPRGCIIHLAEEVKKRVKVPVITVGKIMDSKMIERILAEEKADLVSFCRLMTADTEFIKKILKGQEDEIRKCIACNWCTTTVAFKQVGVKCAVNAEYGKELHYLPLRKTEKRKEVTIVGGGVAGMEVARVASLRGHKVTLYEKENKLGGLVNIASAHPRLYTRDLYNIVTYLQGQMKKLGVELCLGQEVKEGQLKGLEVAVLATGSKPLLPSLPGMELSLCMSNDQYLKGKPKLGKRIIVVGTAYGTETALSLAREDKEVVLLEEAEGYIWPPYMHDPLRQEVLKNYINEQKSLTLLFNTRVSSITKTGLSYRASSGKEAFIEAEHIIFAQDRKPENSLAKSLKASSEEFYQIGDCISPRTIGHAIEEAAYTGRRF